MSGLHANESATRQLADRVSSALVTLGHDVRRYHVPYKVTLLACVVAPGHADSKYCLPKPGEEADADLEALVGDRALRERFPGFLHFEFHNARDVWGHFGINPDKPVEEYVVGTIMPRSKLTRPCEIGTWRNVLQDGTLGKYCIEAPAVFRPVSDRVREARLARVEQLRSAGYRVAPNVIELYLMTELDLAATRDKGLLGPAIVRKIASWIVSCLGAEEDSRTEHQDAADG